MSQDNNCFQEPEITTEWRTIESAPRDARILICDVQNGQKIVREAEYFEGVWVAHFTLVNGYPIPDFYCYPTHWMPLPTPPEDVSLSQFHEEAKSVAITDM